MLELIGKTNIDFIGKRNYGYVLSTILIVLGIIAFVAILMGKGNLGIDFTGGVMLHGSFSKTIDVADIRDIIGKAGFSDAQITEVHGENAPPNSFLIRAKVAEEESDSLLGDRIVTSIRRGLPDNNFKVDSIDDIGPSVGAMLQSKARLAILLSLLGILVYIWIRFDLRAGVAATVATFHDVFAVLGIFFIMQREINMLFVSALLTLAGYSLTDKVVVYDRIRENSRQFRKKSTFNETINTCLNEVLSRTLITGLSVIFVIIALLFLGGDVIRDFSMALFLGIVLGTYSSWFVATPIIVEWEKRSPSKA